MLYKNILYVTIMVMLGANAYGESIEYNTYTGVLYGFKIDYPSEWVVEESPYTFSYIKVSFIDPLDEYAFVLVGVEEVEDITLDRYEELILAQHSRALKNMTIVETKETILANNTARMLTYKGVETDVSIEGSIVYTIYNNTAYTIITSNRENDVDEYKSIFEDMISSFNIDTSIIPKPISDVYEDEGVRIEFEGWQGLISNIDGDIIIRTTPNIQSDTVMSIIIADISSFDLFNEQIKTLFENGCVIITMNIININGSSALEVMQDCNNDIGRSYLFATTDKVIAIDLITNREEYDKYIDMFEKSIESISADMEDITPYLDDELILPEKLDNIDLNIPDEWNVFKREYNNNEMIYVTPDGSNIIRDYTGILITKPSVDVYEANNLDCDVTTTYYIASKDVLEEKAVCISDDINVELQVIKLDNTTIGYFNTFVDEYSIILENFVDEDLIFAISNSYSQYLNDDEYSVILNGTEYSIKYSYINSTVNSIEFNEDSRSLDIDLTTDKIGMIKIKESLLEEPYVVSINDRMVDIDNADSIIIVYDDDTNVKIVGSKVVPEFPLPWLIIPLSLSIIIIIRHRLFRLD